ncbi:hypothetical protein [Achromobacter sp. RTa]|nr:hypothetical protein [Achromobacter sp. RTa]
MTVIVNNQTTRMDGGSRGKRGIAQALTSTKQGRGKRMQHLAAGA